MNDVVDFAIGGSAEQLRLRAILQVFGQLFEQTGSGASQLLAMLELIGTGTRAARIADLLFPRHDFEHVAGKLSACAPEINLEGERIAARLTLDDPLQRGVGDETAVPV